MFTSCCILLCAIVIISHHCQNNIPHVGCERLINWKLLLQAMLGMQTKCSVIRLLQIPLALLIFIFHAVTLFLCCALPCTIKNDTTAHFYGLMEKSSEISNLYMFVLFWSIIMPLFVYLPMRVCVFRVWMLLWGRNFFHASSGLDLHGTSRSPQNTQKS